MRFIRRDKDVPPVGPLTDLRNVLRIEHGYQFWFMVASAAVTGLILFGFYLDSYFEKPYKSEIVYVQNWRADRTLQEIIAQQKIDQAAREKREAIIKAKKEKRRREFKKVDDSLKAVGI